MYGHQHIIASLLQQCTYLRGKLYFLVLMLNGNNVCIVWYSVIIITCTAKSTRIFPYGVKTMCSRLSCGTKLNPQVAF